MIAVYSCDLVKALDAERDVQRALHADRFSHVPRWVEGGHADRIEWLVEGYQERGELLEMLQRNIEARDATVLNLQQQLANLSDTDF